MENIIRDDIQNRFRSILQVKYDRISKTNQSFSLRSFAKLLQISPSSLSEFLNTKRNFSLDKIQGLSRKLGLSSEQFEEIFDQKSKQALNKRNKNNVILHENNYDIVSDPIYYTLLCVFETKDYQSNLKWLAEKIQRPIVDIENALKILEAQKFIKIVDGKIYLLINEEIITTDNLSNFHLKTRHEINLNDAKKSLYKNDVDERDFIFGTIAIDPTKIPEAKKMIRKFQDELFNFLEDGEKKEVYEICFQLFPRTISIKEEQL